MDHPDFRADGHIFATLGYPDEKFAMVKLTPEQQAEFVKKEPEVFTPVPGKWGLIIGERPTCALKPPKVRA